MDVLFLYWDEELVDFREGRKYGRKFGIFDRPTYEPRDLAFWTQFYTLFYDHLFVPVNFVTDLKWMPEVFELLNISDPKSALRSEYKPVLFSWNTRRFEQDSFLELARAMIGEDDVSQRMADKTEKSALLCEKYLKDRVVRFSNNRDLHREESIKQLREEVFNPAENSLAGGSLKNVVEKCARCLSEIEERAHGENYGYGRNFYYTLFGYHRDGFTHPLAKAFKDITAEYLDIRHDFLCGVDWVSHRLKGRFANDSPEFFKEGYQLNILMPPDYSDTILPVTKRYLYDGLEAADKEQLLTVKEKDLCIIGKEAILGMSADQLEKLRKSHEYEYFKNAWNALQKLPDNCDTDTREKCVKNLQEKLTQYLNRIGWVLNPQRKMLDSSITLTANVAGEGMGFLLEAILLPLETKKLISRQTLQRYRRRLEIYPHKIARRIQEKILPQKGWAVSVIELGANVRIYLEP
ncbi:MAG TPA: hypothetical protein VMX13_14575 [Sedimentisphaerales bacterium]|nr:hypothetical protein [Sedimentisphaerales bacterium]